ncbi:toprim domain-containing protein [Candidatus Woesearchaeota archaeon]|nr:toprim domain-containing protein [Candidatus Woesearchaeota archaeon]
MKYQEELNDWISRLKETDKIIIVEGKNDKKALESFGVSDIIILSKHPLYKIIEDVAQKNKKAIILTDIDKEGKKLYGKLSSGLGSMGVEIDNYFREFLIKKTKLSQIEGLDTYLLNNGVILS